jgi:hypothetical protein
MGKHFAKNTNINQNKPLTAHLLKIPENPLFIGVSAILRRRPCFPFVIPSELETVPWSWFIYWCYHRFYILFGETFE